MKGQEVMDCPYLEDLPFKTEWNDSSAGGLALANEGNVVQTPMC